MVLLWALIKFPNSGNFEALAGVHFISRFLANLSFLAFSFSYRLWGSLSAFALQGYNYPPHGADCSKTLRYKALSALRIDFCASLALLIASNMAGLAMRGAFTLSQALGK